MTNAEGRFVDTNVLVYASIEDDRRHAACRNLLKNTDIPLYISPQILAEFYSTITNSKRVTTPYTPSKAIEFIEILLSYEHIVMLPISLGVSQRWLALLKRSGVRGPLVFDLQIAATMMAHGVTTLITFNSDDFKEVVELWTQEPPAELG